MNGSQRNSLTSWIGLLAIIALAAALRLYGLGHQSLSIDEGLSAQLVEYPLPRLIPEMRKIEQLPPLYHLILHRWVRLPGVGGTRSEAMLRLPSAVFGIAAVGVMFLLGRRLFGVRAGLAAALLMAVSGAQIEQSQNARGYSLFVLLALISCERFAALFERSESDEAPSGWLTPLGLSLSTVLMVHTHLFGVAVVAAQAGVIAIIGARLRNDVVYRRAARSWLLAMIAVALLCLPWAWLLLNPGPSDIGIRPAWLPPPADGSGLRRLMLIYAGSWPLAMLLTVAAAFGIAANVRRHSLGVSVCVALVVTVLIVPVLVSAVWKPVFLPRYGLPAQTALLLLAGAGLASLPRWLAWVLACAWLALSVSALRNRETKPDWRAMAVDLRREAKAGDVIVLSRWFAVFVLDHYRFGGDGSQAGDAPKSVPVLGFGRIEPTELFQQIHGRDVWWVIETRANLPEQARATPPEHELRWTRAYEGLELRRLSPGAGTR